MRESEPVNRLMTEEVLSIDVSAPAGEILRYFAEYPVHHLPVVDKQKVVGMLSSADLMKLQAFLPKVEDPIAFLNERMRIEQIMQRPAVTVGPHASVEQAASLMAQHGIHALPVVTASDGHLLGIITTTDIIQAAIRPAQSNTQHNEKNASATVSPTIPEQDNRALMLASERADANGELGELARAMLRLEAHRKLLAAVLTTAERYLSAGQDEHLHTALLKAIAKARNSESPDGTLGL